MTMSAGNDHDNCNNNDVIESVGSTDTERRGQRMVVSSGWWSDIRTQIYEDVIFWLTDRQKRASETRESESESERRAASVRE